MGSVIALIKILLAKATPGPYQAVPSGLRGVVRGDERGESVDFEFAEEDGERGKANRELIPEVMNALPQTLRVLDIVHEFLEARRRLRQACCGSSLASRMMREMDACEVRLQDAHQELLYPQTPYTPYEEAKADGS